MSCLRPWLAIPIATLYSCIPSNVVAEQDRAVAAPATSLVWNDAPPATLDGLYESIAITGGIAQSMQKVYYWFTGSGEFSGAALVLADGSSRFQTLAGQYRIDGDRIFLGAEAEPATMSATVGHVRFRSPDGTLVLRRVEHGPSSP